MRLKGKQINQLHNNNDVQMALNSNIYNLEVKTPLGIFSNNKKVDDIMKDTM